MVDDPNPTEQEHNVFQLIKELRQDGTPLSLKAAECLEEMVDMLNDDTDDAPDAPKAS